MAEKTEKKNQSGLSTEPPRKAKTCQVEGCKVAHYRAKGYCVKHYRLWRQHKLGKKQRYKICSKEGCRKPMVRRGLCEEHFKARGAEAGAAAP
ncbi:MAG TPA: hypothetical protein VKN99_08955 [Polyangia bacterium]|nr:hypothetical protein [Polyangia bacterium]